MNAGDVIWINRYNKTKNSKLKEETTSKHMNGIVFLWHINYITLSNNWFFGFVIQMKGIVV